MRKVLLASTALLAMAGAAAAADLPSRKGAPLAPIVPAFTWSGFYVGLNAGYGFGSEHDVAIQETAFNTLNFAGKFGSLSPDGAFGGGQVGYNLQYGNFVLGLEADIQGAAIRDTARATVSPYLGAGSALSASSKLDIDWFGTVRPRIGYAFDRVLVYVTGGLAYGGVKYARTTIDTFAFSSTTSKNDTRAGYVLGAGVEYAITNNWTTKLEYQYVDLGKVKASATEYFAGGATVFATHSKARADFHSVRLGVNYKFDWAGAGPVFARY